MSNAPSFIYGTFSLSAHLLMGTVLGRVSVATVKYYDQKASLGGKSLFSLHFHIKVHHPRKSGLKLKQSKNRRQELTQRLWRKLLLACSARLFIKQRTTTPGMVPPTMCWTLPHQSLIKKKKEPYSRILWRKNFF